jgi:alginate O-acetyltransferase complex protein AlgI
MAIGLGRVLGFSYKENFRYPYCSVTPSDFWRRWHISLGSFFREYVYIPLGGSRCGRVRRILNLLIVWALTGLWHGASWNYVLWGVYWFVILVLDKGLDKFLGKIPKALRFLLTTALILIGLAVFYNNDMSLMGAHLAAMFGGGSAGWIDPQTVGALKKYALFLPAALVAATPVVPLIKRLTARAPRLFDVLGTVVSVLIGFVSLLFLVQQSYNPFIYFRF